MQKAELLPAPIDGKNITHDWIYELFYGGNNLATPQSKNGFHQFLTYVDDEIVRVGWVEGENVLSFEYIPRFGEISKKLGEETYASVRKEIMEAISPIEEEGRIAVRYDERRCRYTIDFYFYWAQD